MKLHFKSYGQGAVLVILHGLFGSSANWQSVAPQLAQRYRVLVPDLRNHGESPHSDSMSFEEMARDIWELVETENIQDVILMGHSLGGKIAMEAALQQPNRTQKLVVVDASPEAHRPKHDQIIEALWQLDLASISSRTEASRFLADKIPSTEIRAFLLKNLREQAGHWHWQMNLAAIRKNYTAEVIAGIELENRKFTGPVLFIKGANSDYVPDDICNRVKNFFPVSQLQSIAGAGHWVHAEQPKLFLDVVLSFLERLQ